MRENLPKIDENQLKNQIIDSLFVHAELWQRWKTIQHLPQFKITDVEHVEHFWLASTENYAKHPWRYIDNSYRF